MTFLAPIAAALAAGLSLPVVVLLYVLKLRRRPLRVSAVQFWTQAVEDLEANVPFRRLRASWMLLLHALAVTLLALALGRPALTGWSDPSARIVVVVDRTASMSARDIERESQPAASRLEEAKRRASELVRGARGRHTFSVVAFGAEADLVLPGTSSARAALDAIASITPTDQPGDLAAAARLIAGVVAEGQSNAGETGSAGTPGAVETGASAEIHFFSDGSFEPGSTAPIDGNVVYHAVGPSLSVAGAEGGTLPVDNVGVVSMSVAPFDARPGEAGGGTHSLFLRLVNASAQARDVPVSVTVGDAVASREVVRVPARSESTHSVRLSAPAGGLVTAALAGSDVLRADDSAGVTVPATRRTRVLLVRPPRTIEAGTGRESVDWLRTVLEELPGAFVVELRESDFARFVASGERSRDDLVVFDRVRPSIAPPMPSLSFDAGVPGLELGTGPAGDANSARSARALTWRRAHPVLRDVSLDALVVSGQRVVENTAAEVLARSERGPLIIAEDSAGVRRIVVTFAVENSNWPLLVSFPVFIASAIEYLGTQTGVGGESADALTAPRTGQVLALTPAAGAKTIELTPVLLAAGEASGAGGAPMTPGAGGSVMAWPIPDGVKGPVQLGRLERAGVYRVRGAEDTALLAVSVLDAVESRAAVQPVLKLGGREVPAVGWGDESRTGRVQSAGGRRLGEKEIWHWFVLAAFGVLALEWLVFAARARR